MVEKQESWTIELSFANYYDDPFLEDSDLSTHLCKSSTHDAIPYALADNIEEHTELAEYLGIEIPNRVISEGETTGSWLDTEDWAISCSRNGTFVIGQTVSCNGKGKMERHEFYEETSIDTELNQIRNFENRIKDLRAYDYLDSLFIVGIDVETDEVEYLEWEVVKELQETGSYDLDIRTAKLEKDEANIVAPLFQRAVQDGFFNNQSHSYGD